MTISVTDDRGELIDLVREPMRIVSLVPSDTYTLAKLGVAQRLVGRTEYCVEPTEAVEAIDIVGGTKNVDISRLLALRPDLVVANQEENRQHDIERIVDSGVPCLISFPKTVADGYWQIERLAALFPSQKRANRAICEAARAQLEHWMGRSERPVRVFAPIWMDPLMTVHADTFISDVIELIGGKNVFSDRRRRYPLSADLGQRPPLAEPEIIGRDTRYPRITLAELSARRPELILLPDEPHPFTEADAAVFHELFDRSAVRPSGGRNVPPAVEIRFCDGKDLMWYGLRCIEGLESLARVLDGVRAVG